MIRTCGRPCVRPNGFQPFYAQELFHKGFQGKSEPCIRTTDEGSVAYKGTTGTPAKDAQRILWGGSPGVAAFMNSTG